MLRVYISLYYNNTVKRRYTSAKKFHLFAYISHRIIYMSVGDSVKAHKNEARYTTTSYTNKISIKKGLFYYLFKEKLTIINPD